MINDVLQVVLVFSFINNLNENLNVLQIKSCTFFLETYQTHITFQIDYYLYYKYPSQGFETHHKIKILSCVLWNFLLWIKKKTFSGRIIFTHIHLSNDNRRLRCLRIISTGLRSLSFQSIQCTNNNKNNIFLLDISLIL